MQKAAAFAVARNLGQSQPLPGMLATVRLVDDSKRASKGLCVRAEIRPSGVHGESLDVAYAASMYSPVHCDILLVVSVHLCAWSQEKGRPRGVSSRFYGNCTAAAEGGVR